MSYVLGGGEESVPEKKGRSEKGLQKKENLSKVNGEQKAGGSKDGYQGFEEHGF